MSGWPPRRDAVLFIAGLGGVMHEVIVMDAERQALLLLLGAMMGLPAFLNSDDKRNGKADR